MTWNEAKDIYCIGQEIEGVVIHKQPFGDFLKIIDNQEFSILIRIVDFKDLTPEIYQSGNYNPVGSKVKGKVLGFIDDNKQIIISQKV